MSSPVVEPDARRFELTSESDELEEWNREIWKSLRLRQGSNALFFPAPNALAPLSFARFMNRRKVTFVDMSEISVSTLIKLSAQMRLTNVTVKLASTNGKIPVADSSFDVAYSDWGLSYFASVTGKASDAETITKELVRVLKSGGTIGAIEENGAPVMFPCPPDIQLIRTKVDSPRADKMIMGRRLFSLFSGAGVKKISLKGYSSFLTGQEDQRMGEELSRRIASLETLRNGSNSSGITPQDIEKYRSWLKSQMGNKTFLMQFNSILALGEK